MRHKTIYYILIVVLALSSLGVMLFYFYDNDPVVTETDVSQGVDHSEVAGDYRFYVDDTDNYSFTYPAGWSLDKDKRRGVYLEYRRGNEVGNVDLVSIGIEVLDNKSNEAVSEWVDDFYPINKDTTQLESESTMLIDGREGYYRRIIDNVAGGYLDDLHIGNGDKIYRFSFIIRVWQDLEEEKYRAEIEKLLQSFKFI